MIRTPSNPSGRATPAVAESSDGITWTAIPPGVVTTGRYALIIRSLRPTDDRIDLGAYEVGIGPKAGTPLPQYLRGRVDKACARLARHPTTPNVVRLVLRAELVPPYAVALRTTPPDSSRPVKASRRPRRLLTLDEMRAAEAQAALAYVLGVLEARGPDVPLGKSCTRSYERGCRTR